MSPAFDAEVLIYRAPASADTVTVTASANDAGAAVIYGPGEDADTALAHHQVAVPDAGETLVEVTVTAADGTVRRYRVLVARASTETNTPPADLPVISGTPEVGKVLTGSAGAITDADGLNNAAFAWQWLANDGTDDTEIAGATGGTHEVAPAQAGQTLKVRVTFTDDKGTEETLVSAATETVVDRRPVAATLSVGDGAAEAGRFRLRVAFADAVTGLAATDFTAARVGGDAAAVSSLAKTETGGVWTAWVAAAQAGRYTVRLPAGAAQAGERRSLASVLAVDVDAAGNATAVAGPVVTAVALATASDGTWTAGETVRVMLAFSEPVTVAADGGTPTVGIGLDGTARPAAYASGSGTGTLAVFSYTVTADDGTVSATTVTANSLALNGATIRDAGGRNADLEHPGIGDAAQEPEPVAPTVALTALTLVDTGTGTQTTLADGDALVLADPANASYGLAASVAADAAVGSVLLELTGAKTVTVTDDAPPYSLYGDADGTITGAGLPAGAYTLSATAYRQGAGAGAELGTLSVSFTVAASAVVSPDGLTASFESVPGEHDGSSPFTFRVRFNHEPRVSYTVLRDESFAVTGGEVDKARRVDGRNDLREIHIEPDGWGDVTVMLAGGRACGTEGAICTADGKTLENSPSATIEGPAALSVADASANENTDSGLEFAVTLDRSSTLTVTVDYATSNGTATAGQDYTATSGTLSFSPGDTAKTVTVPVLNDAIDDGIETMTLTLSNASNARIADGSATGTIENSDPLQQAWIARFGRTVASDVVDGITDRLSTARSGSEVRIAGVTLERNGATWTEAPAEESEITDALEHERALKGRDVSPDELLLNSSFHLQGESDGPGGTAWAAWGRFSQSSFEGEADGVTLSGDVTTGLLGADVGTEEWTAGVALSSAKGDGPFSLTGSEKPARCDSGTVESALTSVHPYAQVALSDDVDAWAIGGYGTGDMTIEEKGCSTYKTDIDMTMAAVGLRGQVLDASAGDALDMAVRTDALWLRTSSDKTEGLEAAKATVTRLRLMIDAGRSFTTAAGATLTPTIEAGIRRDAGDAEEGVGFEVGGGLAYQGAGITIEGKVRTLVAHDDSAYEEWGASAAIRIDPGSNGRGMSLTITPTWGSAASEAEQLWSTRTAEDLIGAESFEAEQRLDAELGYGLSGPYGWGTLTPYGGLTLADGAGRTLRTGVRWKASESATVGLEATREDGAGDDAANHAIMLRAQMRF